MSSQNQSQSTFTLRIASGTGAARCTATNDAEGGTAEASGLARGGSTASMAIDQMTAYRTSRLSARYSLSSLRGSAAISHASAGTAYYRRAA